MKIKSGYILRQVMDIYVVIGIGSDAYTPNQIMSVNETGAFLWKLLEEGTEIQPMIDALVKEYETDAETAEKDVKTFIEQLRDKKLIEE